MVFAAHGFAAPAVVFPVALALPVVEDVAAGCPGCLVAAVPVYFLVDLVVVAVVVDCLFVAVAHVVAFALEDYFVVCLVPVAAATSSKNLFFCPLPLSRFFSSDEIVRLSPLLPCPAFQFPRWPFDPSILLLPCRTHLSGHTQPGS